MAIIAYVAGHGITGDMNLSVDVLYFDDNDAANTGIDATHPPAHVLRSESWTYPATLTGADLQAALAKDIRDRGALYVRARAASASAVQVVPVGALVNVGG